MMKRCLETRLISLVFWTRLGKSFKHDHCIDLIFLRRVGGGYIFVHRLLMEHFAEMYVETTK